MRKREVGRPILGETEERTPGQRALDDTRRGKLVAPEDDPASLSATQGRCRRVRDARRRVTPHGRGVRIPRPRRIRVRPMVCGAGIGTHGQGRRHGLRRRRRRPASAVVTNVERSATWDAAGPDPGPAARATRSPPARPGMARAPAAGASTWPGAATGEARSRSRAQARVARRVPQPLRPERVPQVRPRRPIRRRAPPRMRRRLQRTLRGRCPLRLPSPGRPGPRPAGSVDRLPVGLTEDRRSLAAPSSASLAPSAAMRPAQKGLRPQGRAPARWVPGRPRTPSPARPRMPSPRPARETPGSCSLHPGRRRPCGFAGRGACSTNPALHQPRPGSSASASNPTRSASRSRAAIIRRCPACTLNGESRALADPALRHCWCGREAAWPPSDYCLMRFQALR